MAEKGRVIARIVLVDDLKQAREWLKHGNIPDDLHCLRTVMKLGYVTGDSNLKAWVMNCYSLLGKRYKDPYNEEDWRLLCQYAMAYMLKFWPDFEYRMDVFDMNGVPKYLDTGLTTEDETDTDDNAVVEQMRDIVKKKATLLAQRSGRVVPTEGAMHKCLCDLLHGIVDICDLDDPWYQNAKLDEAHHVVTVRGNRGWHSGKVEVILKQLHNLMARLVKFGLVKKHSFKIVDYKLATGVNAVIENARSAMLMYDNIRLYVNDLIEHLHDFLSSEVKGDVKPVKLQRLKEDFVMDSNWQDVLDDIDERLHVAEGTISAIEGALIFHKRRDLKGELDVEGICQKLVGMLQMLSKLRGKLLEKGKKMPHVIVPQVPIQDRAFEWIPNVISWVAENWQHLATGVQLANTLLSKVSSWRERDDREMPLIDLSDNIEQMQQDLRMNLQVMQNLLEQMLNVVDGGKSRALDDNDFEKRLDALDKPKQMRDGKIDEKPLLYGFWDSINPFLEPGTSDKIEKLAIWIKKTEFIEGSDLAASIKELYDKFGKHDDATSPYHIPEKPPLQIPDMDERTSKALFHFPWVKSTENVLRTLEGHVKEERVRTNDLVGFVSKLSVDVTTLVGDLSDFKRRVMILEKEKRPTESFEFKQFEATLNSQLVLMQQIQKKISDIDVNFENQRRDFTKQVEKLASVEIVQNDFANRLKLLETGSNFSGGNFDARLKILEERQLPDLEDLKRQISQLMSVLKEVSDLKLQIATFEGKMSQMTTMNTVVDYVDKVCVNRNDFEILRRDVIAAKDLVENLKNLPSNLTNTIVELVRKSELMGEPLNFLTLSQTLGNLGQRLSTLEMNGGATLAQRVALLEDREIFSKDYLKDITTAVDLAKTLKESLKKIVEYINKMSSNDPSFVPLKIDDATVSMAQSHYCDELWEKAYSWFGLRNKRASEGMSSGLSYSSHCPIYVAIDDPFVLRNSDEVEAISRFELFDRDFIMRKKYMRELELGKVSDFLKTWAEKVYLEHVDDNEVFYDALDCDWNDEFQEVDQCLPGESCRIVDEDVSRCEEEIFGFINQNDTFAQNDPDEEEPIRYVNLKVRSSRIPFRGELSKVLGYAIGRNRLWISHAEMFKIGDHELGVHWARFLHPNRDYTGIWDKYRDCFEKGNVNVTSHAQADGEHVDVNMDEPVMRQEDMIKVDKQLDFVEQIDMPGNLNVNQRVINAGMNQIPLTVVPGTVIHSRKVADIFDGNGPFAHMFGPTGLLSGGLEMHVKVNLAPTCGMGLLIGYAESGMDSSVIDFSLATSMPHHIWNPSCEDSVIFPFHPISCVNQWHPSFLRGHPGIIYIAALSSWNPPPKHLVRYSWKLVYAPQLDLPLEVTKAWNFDGKLYRCGFEVFFFRANQPVAASSIHCNLAFPALAIGLVYTPWESLLGMNQYWQGDVIFDMIKVSSPMVAGTFGMAIVPASKITKITGNYLQSVPHVEFTLGITDCRKRVKFPSHLFGFMAPTERMNLGRGINVAEYVLYVWLLDSVTGSDLAYEFGLAVVVEGIENLKLLGYNAGYPTTSYRFKNNPHFTPKITAGAISKVGTNAQVLAYQLPVGISDITSFAATVEPWYHCVTWLPSTTSVFGAGKSDYVLVDLFRIFLPKHNGEAHAAVIHSPLVRVLHTFAWIKGKMNFRLVWSCKADITVANFNSLLRISVYNDELLSLRSNHFVTNTRCGQYDFEVEALGPIGGFYPQTYHIETKKYAPHLSVEVVGRQFEYWELYLKVGEDFEVAGPSGIVKTDPIAGHAALTYHYDVSGFI